MFCMLVFVCRAEPQVHVNDYAHFMHVGRCAVDDSAKCLCPILRSLKECNRYSYGMMSIFLPSSIQQQKMI